MKDELVGDWVQVEMVPLSFKEGDEHAIKLALMTYIPNLRGSYQDDTG